MLNDYYKCTHSVEIFPLIKFDKNTLQKIEKFLNISIFCELKYSLLLHSDNQTILTNGFSTEYRIQ